MRCGVLGAGKIGQAVIRTLLHADAVKSIAVVDANAGALQAMKQRIDDKRVHYRHVDLFDTARARAVLSKVDIVFVTLPNRRANYRAIDLCSDVGLHMVDVLEEYHRRPDQWDTEGFKLADGVSLEDYGDWLHHKIQQRGVVLLDGMGLAPGLTNVTVGQGIRMVDNAESAIARVGGIPAKKFAATFPLGYMITWAFAHVLREYMVRTNVIMGGRIQEVEPLSGYEKLHFSELGRSEELECAITPGMPSFIYTRPYLQEFAEKTIRWPGHFEGIELLKECGLLDKEPVAYDGHAVSPREFVAAILAPRMQSQQGAFDECVMWNTVTGSRAGRMVRVDYYMWESPDLDAGLTSMAKVTGVTAAIGGLMVMSGHIKGTGIIPPEDAVTEDTYQYFISSVSEHGVHVKEVITELEA